VDRLGGTGHATRPVMLFMQIVEELFPDQNLQKPNNATTYAHQYRTTSNILLFMTLLLASANDPYHRDHFTQKNQQTNVPT